MRNFALVGAAGFVAPRHMKAIADTGNRLVAAVDPHDSVGSIDRYFPEAAFFTEVERFDRHLEKLRRGDPAGRVHYVSICSPNYLHDAHVRLALRIGADAICEKPLVISPWNLDQLAALEQELGKRVYTVMQLRMLPELRELAGSQQRADVELTYITARGCWYDVSWKGSAEKSGGLALNIGVHFFDLLIWLFGKPERSTVVLSRADKLAGTLELDRARVRWFLSVDRDDLPSDVRAQGKTALRTLTFDGRVVDLSAGFPDLHTRVYRDILDGGGYGIEDVRPSIALAHAIRNAPVESPADAHPFVANVIRRTR